MIRMEIDDFVEDNYDNEYAGEAWNKRVESMHLETLCRKFLQELSNECERKRRELTDELRTEIKFSSVGVNASNIQMEGITDTQSLLQLGALGIGLIFSGPIGIALGVLSFFFEDKAEKIRKQKAELASKLRDAMNPVVDKIGDYLIKEMSDNILHKGIDGLCNTLNEMDDMLFELASEEKNTAQYLNNKLYNLNAKLWNEAINYIRSLKSMDYCLYNTARIPGQIYYGIGTGTVSSEICKEMSILLDEKIEYISVPNVDNDDEAYIYKLWDIVTELIGEWHHEVLEFGNDDKIRLIHLENNRSLYNIKNGMGYRLMAQIQCEPIDEV